MPSSGHTGAKLAMHGQRLARAWRAYPSIFAVQEQRSRRIILRQTLREGYVAELAAEGMAPVSMLRVLQDQLSYLQQCGMDDNKGCRDPAVPDPWAKVRRPGAAARMSGRPLCSLDARANPRATISIIAA